MATGKLGALLKGGLHMRTSSRSNKIWAQRGPTFSKKTAQQSKIGEVAKNCKAKLGKAKPAQYAACVREAFKR